MQVFQQPAVLPLSVFSADERGTLLIWSPAVDFLLQGKISGPKAVGILVPYRQKELTGWETAGKGKKRKKKTDRRDRKEQKSVSKVCCDALLIKQPNKRSNNFGELRLAFTFTSTRALLQMLLSNFKLRTLEILGPRERCCPAEQPERRINDWLPHTTNQSKVVCFEGGGVERAALSGYMLLMCINLQCVHTNTQHVSLLG